MMLPRARLIAALASALVGLVVAPTAVLLAAPLTPEIVTAFFDGLGRFVPILGGSLLVVVPLFRKLGEVGATVAKIQKTTADTAAVNKAQDMKLVEVIDLANGRMEQMLQQNADLQSEVARLNGSLLARLKADDAQRAHDEHKAHADEVRAVVVAATAATEAQTVATEAAMAAKVDVPGQVT